MCSEHNNVEMYVLKISQIGSDILKMWAFKRSGLTFWTTLYVWRGQPTAMCSRQLSICSTDPAVIRNVWLPSANSCWRPVDVVYQWLLAILITGPPNGQYSFARGRLSSVVVVCDAAGGRAGYRRARGPSTAARPGAWAVWRPTLHGGPVRLHPVRATPCYSPASHATP